MAEYVSAQINKSQIDRLKLGQTIFCAMVCILTAQVSIFNIIAPFGIAGYCTLQLRHQKSWIISIGTCIGMLLLNVPEKLWYVGLVSVVCIASFSMQSHRVTFNRLKTMCIAGGLTGLITAAQSILNGQLMIYTIAYVCLAIGITVGSVYVFDMVFEGLKAIKSGRKLLPLEHVTMLVLMGICISALQSISIGMIQPKESLFIIVIMVIAYRGDGQRSVVAGIVMGVTILFLSSIELEKVIAICIGGLIAGTVNQHRIGFVSLFLASTGFIVFAATKKMDVNVFLLLVQILTCGLSVIIVPNTFFRTIDAILSVEKVEYKCERDYANKIRKLMITSLNDFSEAHRQLANHFSDLIINNQTRVSSESMEIAVCMSETACNGCARFDYCWNKHSDKLLSGVTDITKTLDKYGIIDKQHLPKSFTALCKYPEEMCDWINEAYLQYKIEEEWSETVQNYRRLTLKQLIGISDAAAQLGKKIKKEFRLIPEWEDDIKLALKKKKMKVRYATAVKQENDEYDVMIVLEELLGDCMNEKSAMIEELVSNIIATPMKIKKINIYPKGTCEIELTCATTFDVVSSVLRQPKTVLSECGDNYSDTEINEHKYLMCISDGMGSGIQAAQESETVVALIEDFMQAGYDIDLTIDTINSILSVRSDQESFATADICEIDLQTGFASIIKVGAVPTFIKRRKGVEMINSINLPIGILEYVNMEKVDVKLDNGDMIIMMSDGIRDVIGGEKANHDQTIIELIDCIETLNPDMVAKIILEKALADIDEKHQDDMTVMVARMMKS